MMRGKTSLPTPLYEDRKFCRRHLKTNVEGMVQRIAVSDDVIFTFYFL